MGITAVNDHSLTTGHGELVCFLLQPTNISVLSDTSVSGRIYALMNALKGLPEVELLCLNNRENFEENKNFLRNRADSEGNPAIRALLLQDIIALDQMQIQMATARAFLVLIRLQKETPQEAEAYLSRIEKAWKDQGFHIRKASHEELTRLLGVYYAQNVSAEQYEAYDGQRWEGCLCSAKS